MCTSRVFLHIFAVLLVCDYGMFSTPSPSSTERTTIEVSNTSDSNTTVTTAESATFGNVSDDYDYDLLDLPTNTSHENISDPGIAVIESDTKSTEVIRSTARPEITRHNTKQNPPPKGKNESGSHTGGIIMLILILILIVLLLGILYFLRKKGRSYSFDLTRVDGPANDYSDTPVRSDQQGVSYEQTNKDLPVCLDYVEEDKSGGKTGPIANGCAGEKTEQAPDNDNDEQNHPEENSFSSISSSTPPLKKVEFNLDLDLIGGDSDFNDLTTDDAPQNQNNNSVSNAGRGSTEEIFTEVSLDEPKLQP